MFSSRCFCAFYLIKTCMCLYAFFFSLNGGTESLGRLCTRSSGSLPELELGGVHTQLESMADRAKTSWLVLKHRLDSLW